MSVTIFVKILCTADSHDRAHRAHRSCIDLATSLRTYDVVRVLHNIYIFTNKQIATSMAISCIFYLANFYK